MSATKERILEASARLLRQQGYTGTGLKQIATEANAPFGSLYHWFPGGKEQLGEEVIRWAGEGFRLLIEASVDASDDLVANVRAFFDAAAEVLVATDYADACPIATVASEVASTNDTLRRATADVFTSWLDVLTDRTSAAGVDRDAARALALQLVSIVEGAFILSRSLRSPQPMRDAGAAAAMLVAAALRN